MTEPLSNTAKTALRHRATQHRDRISPTLRQSQADAFHARLIAHPLFKQSQRILTYCHIGAELPTQALIDTILSLGKQLVLPKVAGKRLTLWQIDDPAQQLTPGRWDILEPVAGRPPIQADEVELFLLPGLAFDDRGGRLGYGGGFFDRLLKEACGIKMGVAFDAQMIEQVPTQPHDIKMDWVITPSRAYNCHHSHGPA